MRKFPIILIHVVDAFISVIIGPVLLGLLRFQFLRGNPSSHQPRAVFLVPGANIQDIYQKYGTLDVYFQDNPNNYFEKCYRFLFCGNNNATYELKKGFVVKERKAPFRRPLFCYLLLLIAEISLLVKKEKIAILHARDPYLCGLVMLVVSKVTHIPFCVSLHADYDERFRIGGAENSFVLFRSRKLAKKLERFVLLRADRVLPIRESLAEYAIHSGATSEKIRVIPHGIDLSDFAKEPDSAFKEKIGFTGKRIVSFVGRFAKENYVYDLVEIAAKVRERRQDVVFLMIGDGPEREKLEHACRAMSLNGSVAFLGFQPRERIPDFRRISDVNLCLMAGFSLIEACAAGRPVISYAVEWHYELVRNGETGYLLQEHDTEGAAEAVLSLLKNPDEAERMGENARKLAFERHALEKTSEIKVHCYEELVHETSL